MRNTSQKNGLRSAGGMKCAPELDFFSFNGSTQPHHRIQGRHAGLSSARRTGFRLRPRVVSRPRYERLLEGRLDGTRPTEKSSSALLRPGDVDPATDDEVVVIGPVVEPARAGGGEDGQVFEAVLGE